MKQKPAFTFGMLALAIALLAIVLTGIYYQSEAVDYVQQYVTDRVRDREANGQGSHDTTYGD